MSKQIKYQPSNKWVDTDEIVPFPIDPVFDPEADYMIPRWWHKLIFWKKYSYARWMVKAEYTNIKELIERLK